MSLVGGKMEASKLAPWVSVVVTAAVAGGTVLAAANYRTGADQVTIEEHTRQIAQIEAQARTDHDAETKASVQIDAAWIAAKEAKDAASQASASAQKVDSQVGSLVVTVTDLKEAVNRLVTRVDGYPPLRDRAPSP